jgi:predicted enzyme related to lactoylglutathione lyase
LCGFWISHDITDKVSAEKLTPLQSLIFRRVISVSEPFVSHVEWCCRDTEKTAEFFQELFGWQFNPFGNNYLLSSPQEGPAVGLLRSVTAIPGDNCLVFITVDSIDQHMQHAIALGGNEHVAKTAIPNYGWYAQIKEPQGNIVGLFEALID